MVLVLSPHFIRKKHPMAELRRALDRQMHEAADSSGAQQRQFLCPVFYSISVEECCGRGFWQLYEQQPWEDFNLQEPKPAADVLECYAKIIAELCTITGLRQDQVGSVCVCLRINICMTEARRLLTVRTLQSRTHANSAVTTGRLQSART